MPFCQAPGCPTIDLKVGDVVVDCLMSGGPDHMATKAEILEIWQGQDSSFTVFGLKLNSTYLEGLRHPWEITLDQAFDEHVS